MPLRDEDARENKFVEPEVVILENALDDLLMAADERRPRSRTDQTDASPEIGAHLEVTSVSAVQREHPLLPNGFAL